MALTLQHGLRALPNLVVFAYRRPPTSHVRGKLPVDFVDLGEQIFKNIAWPVRVYAVVRHGSGAARQAHRTMSGSPTVSRLSIVVLPFVNLGRDTEHDYFVDGITESLTTDLSRISDLFVIGRHTAFSYKGKEIGSQANWA